MFAFNLGNKKIYEEVYDVVVVGGGVVGIGIFRDLALHGIKTFLFDRGDFSSQTSSSSSKMLHGGIRYLETFDLMLIKEALHEKNLWKNLVPHITQEIPFHLPIYSYSKYPKFAYALGLTLYDWLSSNENLPHKMLSKKESINLFPTLKKEGLKGIGRYFDVVMDDTKLALECLYDALCETNAQALSYLELEDVEYLKNYSLLHVVDQITYEKFTIKAKEVVFALGPFTDQVLKKFKFLHWSDKLLPTKGIHIWLKPESLAIKHSLVITAADGRIIFVIPQRGAILVGTTETKTKENYFNITATPEEINYLINNLKVHFPTSNISLDDVVGSFAGIRPLVNEGKGMHETSREHRVFQPFSNISVIAGGKYTTFRTMGQSITANILRKNQRTYNPDLTKRPLRKKSEIHFFNYNIANDEAIKAKIRQQEFVRKEEDVVKRRIGSFYSSSS